MNYDRYLRSTEERYNKKTLSYYLMRKPSDKVLIPYVSGIYHKKVLEAGIGYGYYTKYYINNGNQIKGLDVNPQLGKNTGVEIIKGTAGRIKESVEGKFDYIISFFMTEYLPYDEMERFITQSVSLLDAGGKFAATVIINKGMGRLYVLLAGMKRIKKYNYSISSIRSMVHKTQDAGIRFVPLNSVLGMPFAVLLEIEKK